MNNAHNLEAEGLPGGCDKRLRGRETPAARGLSGMKGGPEPGPSPFTSPTSEGSWPSLSPVPPCAT